MNKIAILFLLIFAFSPVTADYAWSKKEKSEYNNLGEGMLLSNKKKEELQKQRQKEKEEAEKKITNKTEEQKNKETAKLNAGYEAFFEKDYERAFYELTQLARDGIPEAQEIIGVMYLEGLGIHADPEKASNWLLKAAEKGLPVSQHHIAIMYFQGRGLEQDPVKALMWLHIVKETHETEEQKARAANDIKNLEVRLDYEDRKIALRLAEKWLSDYQEKKK